MKTRIIASLLSVLLLSSCRPTPMWEVELTYCDSRPPIMLTVSYKDYMGQPGNQSIRTYKEAVPRAFGQLNVCEVKAIRRIK